MNPFQLMGMMRQSANPQSFMLNMIQSQMGTTPMGQQLLQLAKGNKTQEIESIARNIVGSDYDVKFNEFKKMLGL